MSTSKADNAVDELDLSDIFSLFKRWLYSVLALFFKATDFIIKFWWAILTLIIIGVVVGPFITPKPLSRAIIIVKTNFDSQPYVYNAIEQIKTKILDQDTEFIRENNLRSKGVGVVSAEISPIIDVVSLLEGTSINDNSNLTPVLNRLTADDDTELFASERFYSNYQYHKLEVLLNGKDKTYVKSVLDYVNKHPSMVVIKKGYIANQKERIAENDKTLSQINNLINSYSENMGGVLNASKKPSVYGNQHQINLDGILLLKKELILEATDLKNDNVTSTETLLAISDIQIGEDESFKNKGYIIYPILLVFIFLLLAGIRYVYSRLRTRLVQENFLD